MAIIRVGIIEEDLAVGRSIANMLLGLGYAVTRAVASNADALEMIETGEPDIILLDINFISKKDGIDLAWKISADYGLPFILTTMNADAAAIAKAKEARSPACLIKPFNKDELYITIEICLYNFFYARHVAAITAQANYIIKDALFIKQGQQFRKILVCDILYLESENVYVCIHTTKGKMLARGTLSHYLDLLVSNSFFRIHRSFAVNAEHIQAISTEYITIGDSKLPVSKVYREELLERLRLG